MQDLADIGTTKCCTKCHTEKPVGAFTGRRWWCKPCVTKYNVEWRAKNDESLRAYHREWYRANKDRMISMRRTRRQSNPEYALAERIRDKYGISYTQYSEMLERSGGLCAICRRPPDANEKLHIDHNHSTGQVRDLLCRGCNNGIGNFRERLADLEAAINYLKRHGGLE